MIHFHCESALHKKSISLTKIGRQIDGKLVGEWRDKLISFQISVKKIILEILKFNPQYKNVHAIASRGRRKL